MNVRETIERLLGEHPSVTHVELVGSRARGETHELQDWDFEVRTNDFRSLASDLRNRLEPMLPLGALWDPLADHACYMLIVPGPQKIDLIFDEPHQVADPWVADASTFPLIDVHFWDWTLWLAGKALGGKDELVRAELAKMSGFLLGPLGVIDVPVDIDTAVASYRSVRPTSGLGEAVVEALREHGLVTSGERR